MMRTVVRARDDTHSVAMAMTIASALIPKRIWWTCLDAVMTEVIDD